MLFSRNCNESDYVPLEVDVAFDNHKHIIPVRIEAGAQPSSELHLTLGRLHWIDGHLDRDSAIDRIAAAVGRVEAVERAEAALDDVGEEGATAPCRPDDTWSLAADFDARRRLLLDGFTGRSELLDDLGGERGRLAPAERMLLVEGRAGCGKSALITRYFDGPAKDALLAHHYILHTLDRTRRLDGVVRHLAHALCQRLPAYGAMFSAPEIQKAVLDLDGPSAIGPRNFLDAAILQPLARIAPVPPAGGARDFLWIYIDGVDEAVDLPSAAAGAAELVDEKNIESLLSFFLENLPPWIRVLATCRTGRLAERLKALRGNQLTGEAPLVASICLDLEPEERQDRDLRAYMRARLDAIGLSLDPTDEAQLLARVDRNILHLKLVLDSIVEARRRAPGPVDLAAAITAVPAGLSAYFNRNFVVAFPTAADFARGAGPLLAALSVARRPVPIRWLQEMVGISAKELDALLVKLDSFVAVGREGAHIVQRSTIDWLTEESGVRPGEAHRFRIVRSDGDRLWAELCWNAYRSVWRSNPYVHANSHLHGAGDDELWVYLVHHGVDHLIAAGSVERAVVLTEFIISSWRDRGTRTRGGAFAAVAPGRFRRVVLRAFSRSAPRFGEDLQPVHLVRLIEKFYQVEPLAAPIEFLLRNSSAEEWRDIARALLAADNYVVRYAMAEALAKDCVRADARIEVSQIEALLAAGDVNEQEMAAYALCKLYARDPSRLRPEILEAMAKSPWYGIRSALGGLVVDLTLKRKSVENRLSDAVEFWSPIWEHLRLDVADHAALKALLGKRRNGSENEGEDRTLRDFRATDELRHRLLESGAIRSPVVAGLLEDFDELAVAQEERLKDLDEILGDEPAFADLIRVFFGHPLWNVAETFASILVALVGRDERYAAVIEGFFEDDNWRVRFGAIEAAYQLIDITGFGLFSAAVERFHDDPNSRVRALCAENLIAHLLERDQAIRDLMVDEFEGPIARWVADDDCWVLEHVFRLFKWSDADGNGYGPRFLENGPANLLEGLPARNWRELARGDFLRHIEERRRSSLAAPA